MIRAAILLAANWISCLASVSQRKKKYQCLLTWLTRDLPEASEAHLILQNQVPDTPEAHLILQNQVPDTAEAHLILQNQGS